MNKLPLFIPFLKKRNVLILLVSITLFTAISLVLSFTLKKSYRSEGKILIQQSNSENAEMITDLLLNFNIGKVDPIVTHMEMMKCRTILRKVIDSLKLSLEKEEDLLKHLRFSIVRNTSLISVEATWTSPDTATLIINMLFDFYIQENHKLNKETILSVKDFLESNLALQKKKVEELEEKLVNFKNKSNFILLDKEMNTNIDLINNLYIELSKIEAEEAALEKQKNFYENKIKSIGAESNPLYPIWVSSLEQTNSQLKAVLAKKMSLEKRITTQRSKSGKFPEIEIQYLELIREQKVASELYLRLREKLETVKVQEVSKIVNVKVADPAIPSSIPVFPRKSIIVIGFFLVGLFLGIVLIYGLEYFNPSPHSMEEIENILNPYSVIGQVPYYSDIKKGSIFVRSDPTSVAAEAVHSINSNLKLKLPVVDKGNMILVTSLSPSEGKTLLSINLAYSCFSNKKRKILLIDLDLRRPSVYQRLCESNLYSKKNNIVSISALSEEDNLNSFLNKSINRLDISSDGANYLDAIFGSQSVFSNSRMLPIEFIQSDIFQSLIIKLKSMYELIIIDVAPITFVETVELIRMYNPLVLGVVDASNTSIYHLESLKKSLSNIGTQPNIAIVLNKLYKNKAIKYYNYYYDKYYYSKLKETE